MRVIVIRHHAEDSPGFVAAAFQARGADVSTHLMPATGRFPAFDGVDHIVVLGANSSVNDAGHVPWISDELAWLRAADEAGLPVFGICFGAQALCALFGGKIETAPAKEIGWRLVETADAQLVPAGPWLEFHGDRCLPALDGRILATNDFGVQAFSVGRHLGVQFHPEVDGGQLRLWLEAGARTDAIEAGQDPDTLLSETVAQERASRARADVLVRTALRLAETDT
jgi:GMP synthase-like glutamine amidotransferase